MVFAFGLSGSNGNVFSVRMIAIRGFVT